MWTKDESAEGSESSCAYDTSKSSPIITPSSDGERGKEAMKKNLGDAVKVNGTKSASITSVSMKSVTLKDETMNSQSFLIDPLRESILQPQHGFNARVTRNLKTDECHTDGR